MKREDIANKNLQTLFNISLENNAGADKDMMDILQKYIFGEVFEVGNLDIKTRELLTIVSLSVQQTMPQLRAHVNGALNAGASPVEIREAIYMCAPFIGFPKTLNALGVFNEVIKERGLENELHSTTAAKENKRYEEGYKIQNPIYGDEIAQALNSLPDNIGDDVSRFLTEVCFGDFYTRGGLDIKKRELIALSILVSTNNQETLKSHIKGNLKIGNDSKTIASAIVQCMPYVGFPNTIAALKTLKDIMNNY